MKSTYIYISKKHLSLIYYIIIVSFYKTKYAIYTLFNDFNRIKVIFMYNKFRGNYYGF